MAKPNSATRTVCAGAVAPSDPEQDVADAESTPEPMRARASGVECLRPVVAGAAMLLCAEADNRECMLHAAPGLS